jgi:hypothetical protein
MIGRRGFQIVETPRASSGSVRARLPLLGENHSPPTAADHQRPRITLPYHERAPPHRRGLPGTQGPFAGHPAPDMALGQRRAPLAQANQAPPESTTERSQL